MMATYHHPPNIPVEVAGKSSHNQHVTCAHELLGSRQPRGEHSPAQRVVFDSNGPPSRRQREDAPSSDLHAELHPDFLGKPSTCVDLTERRLMWRVIEHISCMSCSSSPILRLALTATPPIVSERTQAKLLSACPVRDQTVLDEQPHLQRTRQSYCQQVAKAGLRDWRPALSLDRTCVCCVDKQVFPVFWLPGPALAVGRVALRCGTELGIEQVVIPCPRVCGYSATLEHTLDLHCHPVGSSWHSQSTAHPFTPEHCVVFDVVVYRRANIDEEFAQRAAAPERHF